MRVLAVASSAALGGAELALETYLAHRPAEVEMDALVLGDGPLPERLRALGVQAWSAPALGARPTAAGGVAFTRSLSRLVAARRPDVVWATGVKAAALATPACRMRRAPLVWHKVDFSLDHSFGRAVAAACTGVIVVSRAVAAALGPVGRRRVLGVVPPPVRLPASFAAHPATRPTIGTLGRLVPYKGHDRIVAAAALLRSEFPDLRLVLAGDPAPEHYPGYAESLREQIRALGLESHVELPGFADPAEALAPLSVYVTATYRTPDGFGREGLGVATVEASWAGIPVVATRGGGTDEALLDGETGTLVEPGDPAALADAIGVYLRDPALALRTGAAGRAFARAHFAPAGLSRRLFELLPRAARVARRP